MILVETRSILVGLLTVKDVLKFIALERGSALSWDAHRNSGEIYEEASMWFTDFIDRNLYRLRSLVSSNQAII